MDPILEKEEEEEEMSVGICISWTERKLKEYDYCHRFPQENPKMFTKLKQKLGILLSDHCLLIAQVTIGLVNTRLYSHNLDVISIFKYVLKF
jgi:hypothetical protein